MYIHLSYVDLSIAACLLLITTGLSMILSIGIGRMMFIAAFRLILQLSLIGFILLRVFSIDSVWLSLGIILFMIMATSREIVARLRPGLNWQWSLGISGSVTAIVTILVSMVVLNTALRPHPWYETRYLIPLTGIILGNVMNTASLSLKGLLETVQREQSSIDARLALGDSRKETFAPFIRQAVMTGMLPTINSMSAAGLVTLPGTMSGQILAGIGPFDAAKYQILLLLIVSSAGLLASIGVSVLAVLRLTDKRERLRLDRLSG